MHLKGSRLRSSSRSGDPHTRPTSRFTSLTVFLKLLRAMLAAPSPMSRCFPWKDTCNTTIPKVVVRGSARRRHRGAYRLQEGQATRTMVCNTCLLRHSLTPPSLSNSFLRPIPHDPSKVHYQSQQHRYFYTGLAPPPPFPPPPLLWIPRRNPCPTQTAARA